MYEKLKECPSCKHPKFSNYKICKDFSVSKESFALVECHQCNLIFTNPRPDLDNIGNYYKSENYISHTNKGNNLVNLIYKQVRNITLRQKLSLIHQYTSAKKILDFGCGTGTFLHHCKKNAYMVHGFEPNTTASLQASQLLNLDIFANPDDLNKGQKFDIITAWHVIEHVHNLQDTLALLRTTLKKDGFMFIAVPNIKSFDAEYYKEYWAAYDVPRHLYHFSRTSFEALAKESKLRIQSIHPMKFDSFYVSLLSEKYKTNKTNFIKAINIGVRSNTKASKNGEYSSLIYVLTK